jgi:hypothetical protein
VVGYMSTRTELEWFVGWEQNTHVVRFFRILEKRNERQLVYYQVSSRCTPALRSDRRERVA